METFKLGLVKYFNTAPLRFDLERYLPKGVELYYANPAELNRALAKGEVHAGLISSMAYAREHEDLLLFPDISISATGRVGSVLFFYGGDLRELSGRTIALTPESETSSALLRILLEDFYGLRPRYEVRRWNLKDSGYLAIGDEALILRKSPPFPKVLDLAGVWTEKTGLPFVFAVLAVRREAAKRFTELIKELASSLYLVRAVGMSRLKELTNGLCPSVLTPEEALTYLNGLEYDLSGLKQEALMVFFRHLKRRGEVKGEVPLKFVEF